MCPPLPRLQVSVSQEQAKRNGNEIEGQVCQQPNEEVGIEKHKLLESVQSADVGLGALAFPVPGDESRLADVEAVLGEKLDQVGVTDQSIFACTSSLRTITCTLCLCTCYICIRMYNTLVCMVYTGSVAMHVPSLFPRSLTVSGNFESAE